MSNVTFDEQSSYTPKDESSTPRVPGIAGLLIRSGFATDIKHAKYIMIGIVVVCLSITTYMLFFYGKIHSTISPEEKQRMIQETRKELHP